MKVLVTGANGFLGRHVVRSLLQAGEEVVAAVRSPSAQLPSHVALEVRLADLRVSPLEDLLSGVDVVVHLAAQVTGSDEARFSSTVVGTERLLGALPGSSVSRLVLVSSYSVYDWQAAGPVLDESSPVMESPYQRDGYTVAKVWQERLVREYAETPEAAEVVVLRPGFIWGVGKEDLAGAGVRVGAALVVVGPTMRLPLTHVENCADAVAAAAVVPQAAGQTLNVVDGRGVSAWEYGRLLVALDPGVRLRVPFPYTVGQALVALLAVVMPRLYRHGGKLPALLARPSYAARFRPVEHSGSKAEQVLSWHPAVDFTAARERSLVAAAVD